MKAARILVVDDDALARALYSDVLSLAGHRVVSASSGEEALVHLESEPFELVVTDVLMPGMNGLELLERAKRIRPGIAVIVLTSLSSAEPAVRALRMGAFHYLVKPVEPEALVLECHRCLEHRRLIGENQALRRYHQLLQVSQQFVGCLDTETLLTMSVDGLFSQLGGDAVLILTPGAEGLRVSARQGLDALQAQWVAELLSERLIDDLGGLTTPTPLTGLSASLPSRDVALRALNHALVLPLRRDHKSLGAVAVFRQGSREPFGPTTLSDGAYLADVLALSLDNASRFAFATAQAELDPLTGLFNAGYLTRVLEREIAQRAADRPFSLLFMDLDHFKRVNDTHGHLIGSHVLVEIARLLRRQVREQDVLVRYGGDEFVAILMDADTRTATSAAERIRATAEQHRFMAREGLELSLTLCIGVATWPTHAQSRADMVHRADLAMYHGKKMHRNAVYLFDQLPTTTEA